jgi:excisionase family DNA binding protein
MTARRPVSEEPLMTARATAERLSTPLQTFYDWRKHGRGPKGYRVGGRVLFRWSEVEAWLQEQRETERHLNVVRPAVGGGAGRRTTGGTA